MIIAVSLFLLFLVLLALRIPIGIVLVFVGLAGITAVTSFDTAVGMLSATAYRSAASPTYLAIPLFILMAALLAESNIAREIFHAIRVWIGRLPGGVGVAAVGASAGFGALSGSSAAATSVMAKIAVPALVDARYSARDAAGLIATTTGTLAALIPPSIPLILYGIYTETSINELFVAGIVPGVVIALMLSAYIIAKNWKLGRTEERYSWKVRLRTTVKLSGPLVLLVLLVGVIYLGVATPTEAAAFGAAGALVLGLVMRRLNADRILRAFLETVTASGMIFLIVIGANVFAQYVSLSGIGRDLVEWIDAMALPALAVLLAVVAIYLILGLFLDLIGSMLITLPLLFPLIVSLGYDPIWFGILVVLLLEIGLVTPPVGMNLFITSQKSGVAVWEVLRGAVPYIIILLTAVGLLIAFPWSVAILS